ncbi:uncharacterized protein MYP_2797 [Sporocytophaga myxococcoides]|uniref:Uncharacterized protein n=1 Tax=Sporocytophaga myxococcoides TaxID=153721 RepID=A0A098LHC7_9BACT|nr:PD-(D/E)XK nuclease family protein [Sporocytophaga myxococcoides]GAL85568.1 uncharacterized protein MYP_2797 [Sporocytophaga myxococcoides]
MHIFYLNQVITEITNVNKIIKQRNYASINSLLEELPEKQDIIKERYVNAFTFLEKAIGIKEEVEVLNHKHSLKLNPFKYFGINETKHSFLLSMLLNPKGDHGQGTRFLEIFLKQLGIEKPESGSWTVTAEVGRIDILIKRSEPASVIVIENKSNYAIDQPNQLYRYWYQEIHQVNPGIDYNSNDYLKNFRVVYLSPASWKLPDECSCLRPDNPDLFHLPERIPCHIDYWHFNDHINEWLNECIKTVSDQNVRLREYLKQYLETIKAL